MKETYEKVEIELSLTSTQALLQRAIDEDVSPNIIIENCLRQYIDSIDPPRAKNQGFWRSINDR